MSTRSRKFAMETFNHLYEFQDFGDRMACAYCGDVRESVDHIPPVSLVLKIGTKELRKRGVDLIRVPCCSACNSRLSDRKLGTYTERLAFLYDDLAKRLERKVLWSEDDINEELTGELKRIVSARATNLRHEYLNRFRGMERRLLSLQDSDLF